MINDNEVVKGKANLVERVHCSTEFHKVHLSQGVIMSLGSNDKWKFSVYEQ